MEVDIPAVDLGATTHGAKTGNKPTGVIRLAVPLSDDYAANEFSYLRLLREKAKTDSTTQQVDDNIG